MMVNDGINSIIRIYIFYQLKNQHIINHMMYSTNNKSNSKVHLDSSFNQLNHQARIIHQVQKYFSDDYLLYNKHLRTLILSNRKGWIQISQLIKLPQLNILLQNIIDGDQVKYLKNILENSLFLRVNLTQVRRIFQYKLQLNKSQKIYVKNLKGVPADLLVSKIKEHTNIRKLHYNEQKGSAYLYVQDPEYILQLNSRKLQGLPQNIIIESYLQIKKQKEFEKKLNTLFKNYQKLKILNKKPLVKTVQNNMMLQ